MSGGLSLSLESAFRSFERAASSLEQRHAALELRARGLETRLLDANRQLEAVLDALDSGVAVVSENGTLARTNRAFQRWNFTGPDGRLADPALTELVAGGARSGRSIPLHAQTAAGPRDLLATLVPVGDAERTLVLTIEDVTEVRREEQEGGRRSRLEALGRMAAELAHEVRNPLGGIRLFAGMLEEDLADQPERRRMVEQILAATQGLEATVSNLLNFASPAAGARREVDLAAVADETCALFAPGCSLRGVRLASRAPLGPCVIRADGEALRQVLLNLLGNALAATGHGGEITVETLRNEDRAVLTLMDDGCGIAAEDLPRVFDPFFSRAEGGTGLGLSIVHRIVEDHGGRITLDSRPGAGTRVRVELPAGNNATGMDG